MRRLRPGGLRQQMLPYLMPTDWGQDRAEQRLLSGTEVWYSLMGSCAAGSVIYATVMEPHLWHNNQGCSSRDVVIPACRMIWVDRPISPSRLFSSHCGPLSQHLLGSMQCSFRFERGSCG